MVARGWVTKSGVIDKILQVRREPTTFPALFDRSAGKVSKLSGSISEIGFHGIPALLLESAGGASAVISLFGAQVLSWQPANGEEWIYLSPRAVFGTAQAIRGGVPVCFPQFSTLGNLPRHGFARNKNWKVSEKRQGEAMSDSGEVMVTLVIEDDAATRALWPHQFAAELTVLLSDERLDIEFAVDNRGQEAFTFTAALHTYLKIGDIEDLSIDGLRGLNYRDAVADGEIKTERGNVVMIRGEVDRVYQSASDTLMVNEPHRSLGVHSENFPDVVIWNPGEKRCAEIADLNPNAWQHMVCVEAGAIEQAISLPPGESWWGRQTLLDLAAAAANRIE